MKAIILTLFLFQGSQALAYEPGFFLDPHLAVGFNVAQGTFYLAGADLGYAMSEQLAFGVGAYGSMGQRPEHDRELGAGPFVGFFQPLTSFLVAQIREDIAYIDQRTPVKKSNGEYTHTDETGTASVTSLGLHLSVTRNFGFSVGYRAVLALNNSDIGKDRSGVFLGFSIGI